MRRRRFIAALLLVTLVVLGLKSLGVSFGLPGSSTTTSSSTTSSTTTSTLPPTSSTSTSTSTSTTTSTTPPTTTTTPSSFAVGVTSYLENEPAGPHNGLRVFPVTVRYPAEGTPGLVQAGLHPYRDAGTFPLLVFSAGFELAPETYAGLLDAWAAAGYIVASPTYPLTVPGPNVQVLETDIVHHPGDLSAVLNTLIADNSYEGSRFHDLINTNEIGVVGQSDGGDVSLATVANTCCRDPRVRAAAILSGAELSWFPGTYFTSGSTPLLVAQGTNDLLLNPVSCSTQIYDHAPAPKYYLSLLNQTHLSAYVPAGPERSIVAATTINFFNAYLKNETGALAAMTSAGNNPGLSTLTNQAFVPGPPPIVKGKQSCPDSPYGLSAAAG